MKNKQVITTGKQSRRDYRSVERNTPTQSGMPSGMPPVIMDAFLALFITTNKNNYRHQKNARLFILFQY
jgi:hypothetical protein